MIKINSETYIELIKDWPSVEMELAGWTWEVKYFLFIPYVIYKKKLIKD